ncbi:MAG: nucleotide sugar dehydrogenase [Rhizobiaceae bacterium]
MSAPRIAYAGMTHLGLCSAIAAASKGFDTLGFDPDKRLTAGLKPGHLPVNEPDLDNLLEKNSARMRFSSDPAALRPCDLVYVAPDVPTDDNGQSDLSGLDALLKTVLAATGPETIVVVLSQVPPGYTRSRQQPGRQIYYQVETLVFGRAVERATLPERFIVGAPEPGKPLPAALETYLKAFNCPILPMRFESAELTKIAINCCLVASVTVANTLGELCERINADWSEIAPALKLDRRIGAYSYLSPGLGIAGGNLERDLATVIRFSEQHDTDAGLMKAFIANSKHRKNWPIRTLREEILSQKPDATIGVLGLAYKENTHSIKNSPSIELIRQLNDHPIRVFDPVVPPGAAPHPKTHGAVDALDAAKGVDALAIMTPWPQFRDLAPSELARVMRGRLVLDPYRVLNAGAAAAAGLRLRTLGVA